MYTRVTAAGIDAVDFLQAQLTQDLDALASGRAPLAAWCTPQGRVVALLRLLPAAAGVDLVLPAAIAADVVAGLEKYRLRARVEFTPAVAAWTALAVADGFERLEALALLPDASRDACRQRDGLTAVCPDPARRSVELYGDAAAFAALGLDDLGALDPAAWQAARIRAGIADILPAASARYTPHMLNLDRLGAVSFDKGCYPGQEIVARTQHLGNVKRRAAHYASSTAVEVGDAVTNAGAPVGEIVAAAGRDVLAVVPVELHGATLAAGAGTLVPAR